MSILTPIERRNYEQRLARLEDTALRLSGELFIEGATAHAAKRLHHNLEADRLTFIETAKAGRLHGGDVDEHVLAAVLRHDEPKSLGGIEPLHGAYSHSSELLKRTAMPLDW